MTFNINLGFTGLVDSEARHSADKIYAIYIGDTVLAGDEVNDKSSQCLVEIEVCR